LGGVDGLLGELEKIKERVCEKR
jgi:hypothetical protein